MFPDDVVALAEYFDCPSIAYTYSEPIVWFEYMIDTAKAARAKADQERAGHLRLHPGRAAGRELCRVIDAANVNLKSFDEGSTAS